MTMATAEQRQRSWWRAHQQRLTPWLFLALPLFMFGVYVVWPIYQSFVLSFYNWDGLRRPDGVDTAVWVGWGNYIELWNDRAFKTSLRNNVIWLVLYMLAVPIGLAIAIFLNQTVRGIRIYKSLFFFPFVISQVVVGLMFAWFYAPNFGLFYKLIEFLTGRGVAVLADPNLVTYGIIAAGLWPQIAYCMILYLTGLNNVAPD
jgi:multiple sugar transport system permease protein